jgi:transcriptional regulator with XRE-family HTH domain
MNGTSIGQNIRYFRHAKNLTQVELAAKVSVAPPYISQLESGIRLPSLKVARRIADALGVDVTVLLGTAARQPRKLTGQEKVEMLRVLLQDAEVASRQGDDGDFTELPDGFQARRLASEHDSYEISHVVIRRTPRRIQTVSHTGQDLIFCLKGEVLVQVGRRRRTLGPWDHITFDASQPHSARGRAGSELIWINLPNVPPIA